METNLQEIHWTVRRGEERHTLPKIPVGQFIDGEFRDASQPAIISVVDPARGVELLRVPHATPQHVDQAVAAANGAKPHWAATTPQARARIVLDLAAELRRRQDEFAVVEMLNCGKPLAVANDDIESAINTLEFMAGAGRAGVAPAAQDYVTDHLSLIVREPIGVVGLVTPWNYPLLMAVWKIAPVLMAGNTLVLKPSEITPLSTLLFADMSRGIVPAGVLNVVIGDGSTVGNQLSEHPDIDLMALTGGVAAGTAVARNASKTLKRVHLELGGKAPAVVLEDADLEHAAETIAAAGMWNSGQECGAACRVLVHHSVADRFTSLLTAEVFKLQLGQPETGADTDLGPLISQAHFDRVTGAIEDAKASGLVPLVGGEPLEGPGYFVAPTIFADVPEGHPLTMTEIFGPVISIEHFATDEEAIRRANAVEFGLAGSVFTESSARGINMLKQLDFGSTYLNSHLTLPVEMPWGGFKKSGYGRDLSSYALDDYSRTKHMVINHASKKG